MRRIGRQVYSTAVCLIAWLPFVYAKEKPTDFAHEILLVIGAAGEESFNEGFAKAAERWREASRVANAQLKVIGLEEDPEGEAEEEVKDREKVRDWIENLDTESSIPAWIVYIGHGTHNRLSTSLNLRGPDLDSKTLSDWVDDLDRSLIFIHGGSASSPFISELSGSNRIIITATRSGDEINYARYGEQFAAAIGSLRGDIDQDGQVSLLEAFQTASQTVNTYYKESGRIITEHALIDDNGDGYGTPADWFRGTRVIKSSTDNREPDGFRASQIAFIPSEQERSLTPEQREARNALELEIEALRKRKNDMPESDYYEKLEKILLKLSDIYLPGEAIEPTESLESNISPSDS